MMENLAEYYLDKLHDDQNPGLLLAKFFCSSLEIDINVNHVKMFNRLINLYGRDTPYFAILDCASVQKFKSEDPFPLLVYFCKKRLEKKNPPAYNNAYENLDAKIIEIQKEIKKQKERKIPLKVKEID